MLCAGAVLSRLPRVLDEQASALLHASFRTGLVASETACVHALAARHVARQAVFSISPK
jgi:hypothetical protein